MIDDYTEMWSSKIKEHKIKFYILFKLYLYDTKLGKVS